MSERRYSDQRREILTRGLRQLSSIELIRILNTPDDEVLTDSGNYDPKTNRYCPLALAFSINNDSFPANNTLVSHLIGEIGRSQYGESFSYNNLRGVEGSFYRGDHESRLMDLKLAITDILRERNAG